MFRSRIWAFRTKVRGLRNLYLPALTSDCFPTGKGWTKLPFFQRLKPFAASVGRRRQLNGASKNEVPK